MPPVPAPGVPLNTPVVELNVSPAGNVPVSPKVAAGNPLAVTVKLPAVPTVNVALVGAGDRRSLIDGEREGLAGRCADAVGGGEGQRIGAARPGCRCSAQHAGRGIEGQPAGNVPVSLKVGAEIRWPSP